MIRYNSHQRYEYYKDTSISDNRNCINIFLGIILFMVGVIFVGAVAIPYFDFSVYKQHNCFIDKITYPQNLPNNYSNKIYYDTLYKNDSLVKENQGWKKCNCGYDCNGWKLCINMYTNISYRKIINNSNDNFLENGYYCTFTNDYCISDEIDLEKQMNYSYNIYKNNYEKTITCFYDDNMTNIYLYKYYNTKFGLAITIILILVLGTLLYINIVYCRIQREIKKRMIINDNDA